MAIDNWTLGVLWLATAFAIFLWCHWYTQRKLERVEKRRVEVEQRRSELASLARIEVRLFQAMEEHRHEAFEALQSVYHRWTDSPGDPDADVLQRADAAGRALDSAAQEWREHLESAYGVNDDGPDLDSDVDPADVPDAER